MGLEGGCYLASPRTFRRRRVQVEAETPAFACAPAAWKGGSEGGHSISTMGSRASACKDKLI